jgi:heme ABC exporter ATP-binding subunit CcmA
VAVVLECAQVELRIGYKPLLSGIHLELKEGASLALTGPNGLGKTTLMRVMAGVARPESGVVKVHGEMLWPERLVSFEHRSCYLASAPALLTDHSVYSNLEFFLNCFGRNPTWNDLDSALSEVGLEGRGKQWARTLSTGQKRRLTLAAVLVLKPKLLLADEPTNGLDTEGVELCLNVFERLRKEEGMSVCVASHDERLIGHCQKALPLTEFLPVAKSAGPFSGNVFA